MNIDATGIALLIIVCIVLPYLAIQTARRLGDLALPMPRRAFYIQTIGFQLFLFAAAVYASHTNGIALFRAANVRGWIAAAAFVVIAFAVLLIRWPHRTADSKARLVRLLPQNRSEIPLYLLVCVVAAVVEEVVYRGATYRLLLKLTSSIAIVIAVCAIAFALGHVIQGWQSVAAILIFAIGFHAIVIVANSLWPAIAAHFVYDVIAGILIPTLDSRNEPC